MVKRINVQATFIIPPTLSPEEKQTLGELIIQEIITRTTERNIDKDGKRFKGYSKEYKESFDFNLGGKSENDVNLFLSGEMLFSLQVIDIGRDYIIVGYDPKDDVAGKVEGNVIGSYGQPQANPDKARDFLGLPQTVLNRLIAQSRRGDEQLAQSLANDILGRLF